MGQCNKYLEESGSFEKNDHKAHEIVGASSPLCEIRNVSVTTQRFPSAATLNMGSPLKDPLDVNIRFSDIENKLDAIME